MGKNHWKKDQWASAHARSKDRTRRRKRRWNRYILQILFGSILVAALFFGLSLTVFFNVEKIEVLGTFEYEASDFTVETGVAAGDNLFRINTEELEEQLLAAHVNFDNVEVNRSFPDVLEVKITPAKTVCVCYYDGRYFYVSESGRLLNIMLGYDETSGVPLVGGVDLSAYHPGEFVTEDRAYKPALQFFSMIEEYNFQNVTDVRISETGELTFCYDDRVTVQIGSVVELEYKFQIVKKVLNEYVQEQEGILDARTVSMAYFRPMTMAVQIETGKAVDVLTEFAPQSILHEEDTVLIDPETGEPIGIGEDAEDGTEDGTDGEDSAEMVG